MYYSKDISASSLDAGLSLVTSQSTETWR